MVRKALGWLVVAFVVYYLVSAPTQAADAVRGAGEALQQAVTAILAFFAALVPDG